jgi:uncharacterized Zn finger protein
MKNDELKPCPFCSCRSGVVKSERINFFLSKYVVWCATCGSKGRPMHTAAEAIKVWQDRTDIPSTRETELFELLREIGEDPTSLLSQKYFDRITKAMTDTKAEPITPFIKGCACGGSGEIPRLGGTPIPCPNCSAKIG